VPRRIRWSRHCPIYLSTSCVTGLRSFIITRLSTKIKKTFNGDCCRPHADPPLASMRGVPVYRAEDTSSLCFACQFVPRIDRWRRLSQSQPQKPSKRWENRSTASLAPVYVHSARNNVPHSLSIPKKVYEANELGHPMVRADGGVLGTILFFFFFVQTRTTLANFF